MTIPENAWSKSSYSSNDDNCVEVAKLGDQAAVRDSKDPEGGYFKLPAAGWRGLIEQLRQA
ncbi:DUF397 domain-containing protein [Amycolatopsis plumensis]|uniref:DUF397 domain-containing protein n=1 Tax=Amycolatopsis plumensis TaxID=236508 RepID=A0ABV5U8K5_9PSEU